MAYSSSNEIDLIDVAALVIVPFAAAMLYGVYELTITVFGGFDFTSPLWTLGGAELSVALFVCVFGTAWIVATNQLNPEPYDQWEYVIIVLAFAAPILYVFVPAVASLVNYNDVIRLLTAFANAGAAVYVSYAR